MTREIDKERAKAFLKEYYKICTKYGYVVDGCGCCDSPFLTDVIEFEKETIELAKARGIPTSDKPCIKEFVILSIKHLMTVAGFSKEEIKDFIQEITKET